MAILKLEVKRSWKNQCLFYKTCMFIIYIHLILEPGSHVHIYNMHIAKADLRTVHTEKAEITNVNID